MYDLAIFSLLRASWETVYTVFVASFVSILLGLGVGVLLFVTQRKISYKNILLHRVVGALVNIVRSIPFIILMISVIPLTRLLVGTSIGTNAAIIPLIIAAIPFFARISEAALSEVPKGLMEAATAMGATNWQIIYKVLIPESLPSLIKGGALTVISLIGYSAMAGAVGGGGLGELAINYGYQRFNLFVMIETVILLILFVQLVQSYGNYLVKKRKLLSVAIISIVLWGFCIGSQVVPAVFKSSTAELKIGITAGVQAKILQVAQKEALNRYGLKLKIVEFDDYVLPNSALNSGDIDANIFQHLPYLTPIPTSFKSTVLLLSRCL